MINTRFDESNPKFPRKINFPNTNLKHLNKKPIKHEHEHNNDDGAKTNEQTNK